MPEATVEVLTAEVRTLMIGNRQVTQSVFNQLDMVASTEIEPFGRVNVRGASDKQVTVVGRDLRDGSLVASTAFDNSGTRVKFTVSFGRWLVLRSTRWSGNWLRILEQGGYEAIVDDVILEDPIGEPDLARCDEDVPPGKWRYVDADARVRVQAEAAAAIEARVAERLRYKEWAALPLIVLAGLR